MIRIHPAAEEQLRELEPDADDVALLEHVLGDDRPPQGLHQHGFQQTEEEQDWFVEWRYGPDLMFDLDWDEL